MGTRGLTAVVLGGDFKIAQYGQWDHYPDGQGKTALEFLQKLHEDDKIEAFHAAVGRCHFYSAAELSKLDKKFSSDMRALDKHDTYKPKGRAAIAASHRTEGSLTHLSRDVGAEILDIVLVRPDKKLGLQDMRGFAGDSLFCEWAYVIDLDQGLFEVYKGFNKEPTPADSRFPSGADWLEKASQGYEPVKLVKSWPLRGLPTLEAFLAEFMEPDEEEDEADAAA